MKIPFNRAYLTGDEREYIQKALDSRKLCGNNEFTRRCHELIERNFKIKKTLLTPSCTDALEMAALLLKLKPIDEVIMPSYTFSSTANAVCLRGANPLFVDIRTDTLNINEEKIEEAITENTRAIVVVHYGGVSAEMDKINRVAKKHNLFVIEDAAQGVNAKYNNKYLGSISDLGAYSFHESKNYTCGEGGALLINNPEFIERSEILWEKGTDRSQVIKGQKDKYSWIDLGSSFLLSDILAAFLYAQLLHMDRIKKLRRAIYERYYNHLSDLREGGLVQLPTIPKNCESNYHSFFILLKDGKTREHFLKELRLREIHAYIGYVPLHLSRMGVSYGYKKGSLPITEDISERIVRLPFYTDMNDEQQTYIVTSIKEAIKKISQRK